MLLLPGLAQKIQSDVSDPDDEPSEPNEKIESENGEPAPLKKIWGAMARPYKLRYQRDRRLNQQPLFVVLPIKEPVAGKRQEARSADSGRCPHCRAVACGVGDRALRLVRANRVRESDATWRCRRSTTATSMRTSNTSRARCRCSTSSLSILDVKQPTPITQHPKEFVEIIRKYNQAPLAKYFFSAYPLVSVAEVKNSTRADS